MPEVAVNALPPIASLLAEKYLKRDLPDTYSTRFRMNRALTAESASSPN